MYVSVPVVKNNEIIGSIFTSSSVDDLKITVSDIRTQMLSISLISGIFVIILSMILSNSMVKPIRKLIDVSKRMSKGFFKF